MKDILEEGFSGHQRNAWLKYRSLSLYFRKGNSYVHDADYELANMDGETPGSGDLHRFFDEYGEKYTFYIENIFNESLINFFTQKGLRIVGEIEEGYPTNMISEGCRHIRDVNPPSMGL